MGRTTEYHRPLVSGIGVVSARRVNNQLQTITIGTLTGLATRNSDGKKMLVTNSHVMTGDIQTNPSGNEEMYQDSVTQNNKVGSIRRWVRILDKQRENIADVAMCELDSNVDADFTLHDSPHSSRQIIAGVEEPIKNMELTMLGLVGGEGTVKVLEVDDMEEIGGRKFTGLIELDCSQRPGNVGDSGAPCLFKVRDGRYRMCGILFSLAPDGRTGRAFPASVAERTLGITFGAKLPDLSLNEQSGFGQREYGTWQDMVDFDGDLLDLRRIDVPTGRTPRWSGGVIPGTAGRHGWWNAYLQGPSSSPTGIRFLVRGHSSIRSAYVAGSEWGFKVYIKRDGETAWKHVLSGSDELADTGFTSGSDNKAIVGANFSISLTKGAEDWPYYFRPDNEGDFEVKIEGALINSAPVAHAGPNRTVNTGDKVTLIGSGSDPDGDDLTYAWTQLNGTRVGLTNTTIPRPTFTAPSSAGSLRFRLTVTDEHGASGSDYATITVSAPVNSAPTAHAGPNRTVNTGDKVTLIGSGSDPDGDDLTYAWTQLNGTRVGRLTRRYRGQHSLRHLAPEVSDSD